MKSLFKSNISWFVFLYLFGFPLPYAMEENETNINIYSVNQLQNDFIGLKKNPQKYVKFHLNAETTAYPDAGGLYELLPYYQKINPLGEKTNYAIQWCDFEKKWQLIKVNPLGDLPRLNVEQTTIATLLEGDQFSRPTNADIKAYTTYEQMKSAVKIVGEKNKELKMKIIEMEEEIIRVQTKKNDEITSIQEKNEKLQEILAKIKEQNKKFKIYALEQNNIAKKANEQNKIQAEENQKILKQLENLTSNLKETKIQIEKKNEENRALEFHKGDLAYKLDHAKEFEQKFLSLEKEIKPLKAQIKCLQAEIKENLKQWDIRTDDMQNILKQYIADVQRLNEDLKNCNNEKKGLKDIFEKFKRRKQDEINKMKNWDKEMRESQIKIHDLETRQKEMLENNDVEIKRLKDIYDAETKELKAKLELQQELFNQQTKVINVQENALKFKDFGLNNLMNNFQLQIQYDDFVSDSQEIEFENGDDESNYSNQTLNNYWE